MQIYPIENKRQASKDRPAENKNGDFSYLPLISQVQICVFHKPIPNPLHSPYSDSSEPIAGSSLI